MTSSYIPRGGCVGGQNPKDQELKRQFWAGMVTEQKNRYSREPGPDLGRLLEMNANTQKVNWPTFYNPERLELDQAA